MPKPAKKRGPGQPRKIDPRKNYSIALRRSEYTALLYQAGTESLSKAVRSCIKNEKGGAQ